MNEGFDEKIANEVHYGKFRKKGANAIAMRGMYIALVIGSGYALFMIPWIEFVSVLVYSAGYIFGRRDGAAVGMLSMGIYAFFNPIGASPIPLYATQVAGMGIIGFAGGCMSMTKAPFIRRNIREWTMVTGVGLTALYDILTNLMITVVGVIPLELVFLSGMPVMVLHMATNAYLFAIIPFIVRKIAGQEAGAEKIELKGEELKADEMEELEEIGKGNNRSDTIKGDRDDAL